MNDYWAVREDEDEVEDEEKGGHVEKGRKAEVLTKEDRWRVRVLFRKRHVY